MGITKAALGRLLDVRPSMVSKYARAGWLVMDADGLIDPEASKRLIKSRKDPSRGGKRSKPANERRVTSKTPRTAQTAPKTGETFEDVRKAREKQTMEINGIKLAQARSELVTRDGVVKAAFENATAARHMLELMPSQLATSVAAEADPRKVKAMLTEAIERVCQQISDAARALPEQLSAMTPRERRA